mgnify:FL=1
MDAVDVVSLQKRKLARWAAITVTMATGLVLTILFTLNIGAVHIPFETILEVLMGGGTKFQREIIINTRLPRIILGALV